MARWCHWVVEKQTKIGYSTPVIPEKTKKIDEYCLYVCSANRIKSVLFDKRQCSMLSLYVLVFIFDCLLYVCSMWFYFVIFSVSQLAFISLFLALGLPEFNKKWNFLFWFFSKFSRKYTTIYAIQFHNSTKKRKVRCRTGVKQINRCELWSVIKLL